MLQLHPMPRHRNKASARARRKLDTPQDEQGQRLDAARAAFRFEWQAKMDRKRQQAVQARRCKMRWDAAQPALYYGGVIVITFFSLWYSVRLETIVAAPLLVIILTLISWRMRRKAECLEREVQELEHS